MALTNYPVPPEGKLGTAPTEPLDSVGSTDFIEPLDIAVLFPWLPPDLIAVFDDAWAVSGDTSQALAAVYAAPELEEFFPGIRRDDGTLRMDPLSYLTNIASYRAEIASLGINPDLFESKYAELIEGEVSVQELSARIDDVHKRVLTQGNAIRQEFAELFGVSPRRLTDAAIIAGVLDPTIGQAVLDQKITLAEISGEAITSGFTINLEEANRFLAEGFNRQAADEFFDTAELQLPLLDELAKRHLDPDDTFSLQEFAEGVAFNDPFQQRRLRRLLARERATFTGARGRVAQSNTGLLTGLADR